MRCVYYTIYNYFNLYLIFKIMLIYFTLLDTFFKAIKEGELYFFIIAALSYVYYSVYSYLAIKAGMLLL